MIPAVVTDAQRTVATDLDTLRAIVASWRTLADQLREAGKGAPVYANDWGEAHTVEGWASGNLDFARELLETFVGEATTFMLADQEENLLITIASENELRAKIAATV